MKIPKLLKVSQEILDESKLKKKERKKCLIEIQDKLKKKTKKLKEDIKNEECNEKDLKRMKKNLAILKAQRKKIIKTIKSLK